MSGDENLSDNLITIDGKNYSQSDMSEEQLYFLRQIQNCNIKINNLKFDWIKFRHQQWCLGSVCQRV